VEKNDDKILKVKSDALRLLAFRPRSVAELRGKLEDKGHQAGDIAMVLEEFEKKGLLNDEKFGRLLVQSKLNQKPSSKRVLEMELKKKGLSPKAQAAAMETLSDYDEKAAAMEIAEQRAGTMEGLPREKKKQRLYGFLKRRGFSDDVVFTVMNKVIK
jgi:regulatory protein